MFVLAMFANFVVLEGIVVADDPAATFDALAAEHGLLRLGIVAFLLIAVLDVLIAWALHVLLRPGAPARSQLAAWLRLLYAGLRVVLGAAGAAYVVDALLQIGMTQYADIEGVLLPVVASLSVLGEGWFAGWLLVRARRDR